MWSRRSTWESHIPPFALGSTQFVVVEPNITIANMVAQHGIRSVSNPAPYIPIRYDSLAICLDTVAVVAKEQGATVHMPRIGCGLADGRWEEVEPIIVDKMVSRGVAVYVYDLPGFPA
jgi:alpha-beta hydrolase superfamily lysophospholipase